MGGILCQNIEKETEPIFTEAFCQTKTLWISYHLTQKMMHEDLILFKNLYEFLKFFLVLFYNFDTFLRHFPKTCIRKYLKQLTT